MGKQRELSPAEKALLETNIHLARTLLKLKEALDKSVETMARTKELAEEQLKRDRRSKSGMKS
ncbi:MAG: hypothetical protein ABSD98_17175 [Candidatus Korobacteraceae bacterium]